MKKLLQTGKIWTILSALIFIMTFGFVAYATTSWTTNNPFSSRNTTKMGNILTANDWNNLMANLDSLEIEGGGESIPDGMIAPFNGNCPTGWSLYSNATVPGGTASKKWCIKGDADADIHIRFVTYCIAPTTSGIPTGTTIFYGVSPMNLSVDPNTSISQSTNNSLQYVVGPYTATAVPSKTVNGHKYNFRSWTNNCGSSATTNCEIRAYYDAEY